MAFAKITFKILDRDAIDAERGLTEELTAMFNPAKYTFNKAAQYAEINIPGLDSPILQYVRGQNERLSLELFFDTTTLVPNGGLNDRVRNVDELTKPFYQLVKLQPKTHAPPRVQVTWGGDWFFKAVVDSVQREYTLFNPQGVPVRATLTLALREYLTLQDQVSGVKRASPDFTKRREVMRGDTLSLIAFEEYQDAAQWRLIAEFNELDNPLAIAPGMVLRIPPLDTGR
jgi:hypothetical protein